MSDTEQLLKIIANQLGGTLKHLYCSEYGDRDVQYRKYVIEYDHQKRK